MALSTRHLPAELSCILHSMVVFLHQVWINGSTMGESGFIFGAKSGSRWDVGFQNWLMSTWYAVAAEGGAINGPWDLWEPAHLKTVLTGEAIIQTGHLMFGNEWADVAQLHGLPEPTCMDPLTHDYSELGTLNAPTHLKPGIYRDHLFADLSQTGGKQVLETYAYKGSQTIALWSLIPPPW
ncbi:hypothetical protein FA15DRAFT_659179 [Coprinopsis marcescibilis]|uniref:Uncharacterized protein n=1 Tax=Coprinopsis marcescibilis TaxID=230819 RepID=A0A5C3KKA3_COPMA|nr:hypothetical protein FA15DRAFT_659179 [Coprinopsis marcescibilis]